jgi:hypothetical protein
MTIPHAARTNQKKGVTMDIPSLEKAFSVANIVYITAVLIAAAATFLVSFFASKLTEAKDAELKEIAKSDVRERSLRSERANGGLTGAPPPPRPWTDSAFRPVL